MRKYTALIAAAVGAAIGVSAWANDRLGGGHFGRLQRADRGVGQK